VARIAAGLPAGAGMSVELAAPPCAPGSVLTFTLDARAEVDESREGDDVVTRPCPALP
jgi:hypothetical protein